jgi:copper chaperone CopZ
MSQTSETKLKIEGMGCQGCVKKVDAAIRQVEGVEDCCVDLPQASASVTYNAGRTGPKQVAEAITRAGYQATALWEQLI